MVNVGIITPLQRGFLNKELNKHNNNKMIFERVGKFTYLTDKPHQAMRWGLNEMNANNND